MKRILYLFSALLLGLLLSSCGVIPTLPPLDSTVTVRTPQFTIDPVLSTADGQVGHQGTLESPLETPTEPLETVIIQPKPTQTQIQAGASPTPVVTATSQATSAPQPTKTATPFAYDIQIMNPHYLPNFTRPQLGCDWLGVGGQIFSREGVVQKDLIIKAGGDLGGSPVVEGMTMPLAEPEIDIAYGPGGYELTLANSPLESESSLWIQLFSLGGEPLSGQIYLTTYDDCQKNLLLVNFMEQ